MDASPTGAGLCSAPSTEAAVRELWRLSEQRGFYTKLEAPSSAALRELGFESSVPYESNEDCSGSLFPSHNSLAEGILFDCIELSYTAKLVGRRLTLLWVSRYTLLWPTLRLREPLSCARPPSLVFSSLLRRGALFATGTSVRLPLLLRPVASGVCDRPLAPLAFLSWARALLRTTSLRALWLSCAAWSPPLAAFSACTSRVRASCSTFTASGRCSVRVLVSCVGVPAPVALLSKVLPPGCTTKLGSLTLVRRAAA